MKPLAKILAGQFEQNLVVIIHQLSMPAVVSISYVHYLINRNDNNLFRLGKIKELG